MCADLLQIRRCVMSSPTGQLARRSSSSSTLSSRQFSTRQRPCPHRLPMQLSLRRCRLCRTQASKQPRRRWRKWLKQSGHLRLPRKRWLRLHSRQPHKRRRTRRLCSRERQALHIWVVAGAAAALVPMQRGAQGQAATLRSLLPLPLVLARLLGRGPQQRRGRAGGRHVRAALAGADRLRRLRAQVHARMRRAARPLRVTEIHRCAAPRRWTRACHRHRCSRATAVFSPHKRRTLGLAASAAAAASAGTGSAGPASAPAAALPRRPTLSTASLRRAPVAAQQHGRCDAPEAESPPLPTRPRPSQPSSGAGAAALPPFPTLVSAQRSAQSAAPQLQPATAGAQQAQPAASAQPVPASHGRLTAAALRRQPANHLAAGASASASEHGAGSGRSHAQGKGLHQPFKPPQHQHAGAG
jgi:hypothetical protein